MTCDHYYFYTRRQSLFVIQNIYLNIILKYIDLDFNQIFSLKLTRHET